MKMESPARAPLALTVAQLTGIGGRQTNQDALGMAEQDELACFVVSDGAGGHLGGEIASRLVVQAVLDSFVDEQIFSSRALQSYIDAAIAKIAQEKTYDGSPSDMSATVAAVLIDRKNRCASWAHLGDTRVYLFRAGKLHSVTKDHSVVQQYIDAGYCKPEQARTHPQRSILFAAIGAEGDTRPEVAEAAITVEDGDALFMCSDGFWEWITETEMEQALFAAGSVEDWLARMAAVAENNHAACARPRDNYSAFALWLGAAGTGAADDPANGKRAPTR